MLMEFDDEKCSNWLILGVHDLVKCDDLTQICASAILGQIFVISEAIQETKYCLKLCLTCLNKGSCQRQSDWKNNGFLMIDHDE